MSQQVPTVESLQARIAELEAEATAKAEYFERFMAMADTWASMIYRNPSAVNVFEQHEAQKGRTVAPAISLAGTRAPTP